MAARKPTTFRIDDELVAAMEALKERDGIAFSEQIRRALRRFLEEKGAYHSEAKPRASRRKPARS
jgi:hypothetical protein